MDEVINKCMLDGQGNNKEYFTLDDFVYACVMRPNEHWSETEAEQTLQALMEDGTVQEFEPGRFKPTS